MKFFGNNDDKDIKDIVITDDTKKEIQEKITEYGNEKGKYRNFQEAKDTITSIYKNVTAPDSYAEHITELNNLNGGTRRRKRGGRKSKAKKSSKNKTNKKRKRKGSKKSRK